MEKVLSQIAYFFDLSSQHSPLLLHIILTQGLFRKHFMKSEEK